ncbi:retrovirus-related pol polyprotein from transposon TNT 1-94 [Tanacetum coccineum]
MKPLRFQDESNMAAYAFVVAEEEDTHEPLTYQEAVACEDSSKWKAAMKEEMDSLRKNKTWELVDYPTRQKLVSCKWLFKIKEGIEGVQKPRCKDKELVGSWRVRHEDTLKAKKKSCVEIARDQNRKILRVLQSGYVSKILNNFRIDNRKSVKMPLGGHFKLSLKDCPVKDCDVERMRYLAKYGSKIIVEAVKWIIYRILRGTGKREDSVWGTDQYKDCCKLEGQRLWWLVSLQRHGIYMPYTEGYEGRNLGKGTLESWKSWA